VKKNTANSQPIGQLERSPVAITFAVALSAVLLLASYLLFREMSGWAFIIAVPAVFFTFQTVWLLLNPFANVFDGRVELHRSLFDNRIFHFNDIQALKRSPDGKWFVVFNDEDAEPLDLRGLRRKDLPELIRLFDKN
jgi:hypothetical protein